MLFLGVNVLFFTNLGDNIHSRANGEGVVADEASDSVAHIANLAHFNQDGNVVKQGAILGVLVPRQDRQALLRLKHVGCRRVINDNRVPATTA